MNTKVVQSSSKNRFLKLSLKKNRLKAEKEHVKEHSTPNIIVLDESFDRLMSNMTNTTPKSVPKVYSPIVINDSSDMLFHNEVPHITLSSGTCTPCSREPSRTGNVSFNISQNNDSIVENKENQPNVSNTWSPAQNIICATPKYKTTPSTPKDVANESLEECTMKKIQWSQRKVLKELYGEIWKSLPSLCKTLPKYQGNNHDGVAKRLMFDEEVGGKEHIRGNFAEVKKLYLTGSDAKKKVRIDDNEEKRSKKRLYTEKIPNTPEPKQVPRTREVKSTTKKINAKTVTEMVEKMSDFDDVVNNLKKINLTLNGDCVRLSFMASLAGNVPVYKCNVEALIYKDDYKNKREKLTQRLFEEFNETVFDNGLDADMALVWDAKLRSTAGTTTNRLIKNSKGDRIRTSSIKLSTKVVDTPVRLRDTLIHEMCHSATWVIDDELRAGHGPLWKKWASKALRLIPELEEISRCHDMEIHFKYTYKCTKCGYSIHRHSKSIDVTKKCCGHCRGTFQVILNKKTKDGVVSTPARQGSVNEFAQYVKDNYSVHKQGSKNTHAQIMKVLSQEFSAKKNTKKLDFDSQNET